MSTGGDALIVYYFTQFVFDKGDEMGKGEFCSNLYLENCILFLLFFATCWNKKKSKQENSISLTNAFEPFLVAHIQSPSFRNSCLPRIVCKVKEKSACFTIFYFTHHK